MDKRLIILAAGAYLLLNEDDAEAAPELPPGYGYGPPLVPGGPPTIVPGAPGGGPAQSLDIYQGANPTRASGPMGAAAWMPARDYVDVLTPPAYGVVGCCAAWATAYPTVRGARSGGGVMASPKSTKGRGCGCKAAGQAGSRSWFMPVEQANRRPGHVPPHSEVAPGEGFNLVGDGAGVLTRMRGFIHDGVAWVIGGRNWLPMTDANPNVVYITSNLGRAAYDTVRAHQLRPNEYQPLYKGKPVPADPNPWNVSPWREWMNGEAGGRGGVPLEADLAGGRLDWDFVGPPWVDAFMRLPVVPLPLPEGVILKPSKTVNGGRK